MCPHPDHLTDADRALLREAKIAAWPCPGCARDEKDDTPTMKDGE